MSTLTVDVNSLTGTLPASLSSCTEMRHLFVRNNFLSGEIALRTGISCEGLHQRSGT
jgi:hypothetical protein